MSQRLAKNHTVKIIKSQIAKKQDHSTLLNSTEVWREKCRMYDPSTREPNKLQYIKDVPRLYVFLRKGMLIFNVSNLYLNISFFQICPMEKQGIDGAQGYSNISLKSKTFSFQKCIYSLTEKAIKKYTKHWYILMFIFLYERTFLFPSDDEHNKLWVNECWIYPRSSFHAYSALQLYYKVVLSLSLSVCFRYFYFQEQKRIKEKEKGRKLPSLSWITSTLDSFLLKYIYNILSINLFLFVNSRYPFV